MSDVGRDYNDAWWSCSGWAQTPRPKSIGTFHLINGGAAAAAHTHTHTRLFASYISRITCPLRIKKRWIENIFSRVTKAEIQSIRGILFVFPAIIFDLKKRRLSWRRNEPINSWWCLQYFSTFEMPKKWARINDRREGSTWFLIQKGRNHLRLPRSIDNKRITPGIYYTLAHVLSYYTSFCSGWKLKLILATIQREKFRKKIFNFQRNVNRSRGTDVHANHLPNDTCSVSCHHHTTGRKKKKKKKLNAGIFEPHSDVVSMSVSADTLENNIPECCRMINALLCCAV